MCSTLALCGCFATAVGFYVLPRRLWLVCIGTTDKNSIASKVVSSTGIENCNVHFDHILNSEWLSYQIQDILYGIQDLSKSLNPFTTRTLKLRRAKLTEKRQPRFDVSKFRDSETCGKFQIEIRNRFSVLEDEQELDIAVFNKVLMDASDKVLGNKKNKKEEWITGDTWKKIDERKETKKKLNQATSQRLKDRLQTAYSEQDKEVKRMTRKDKKEFVDKVADEAENAAERRDLRSLYKITKTLTGGFHNNDRPVKNIND